jgi:hypothetical protein
MPCEAARLRNSVPRGIGGADGGGGARIVAVRGVVLGPLVSLLVSLLVGCESVNRDPAPAPPVCADVAAVCPQLSCVEYRVDESGCRVCECARQACLFAVDCAPRALAARCDTSALSCEPAPACTDDDASTACPAACWGRCLYDGEPTRTDGYCFSDVDCVDGGSCRFSTCVDDPAVPGFSCVGFCARDCAPGNTFGFDPTTGSCNFFEDQCLPPGWVIDRARCG